jgi:hypothetical protein
MKCQIDEHLNGCGNLLIIREFNRDGLSFRNNRHAVRRHDTRLLGKFTPSHAPSVHDAEAWTDRLIRGMR